MGNSKGRGARLLALGLTLAVVGQGEPFIPNGGDGRPLPHCRMEWAKRGIDPEAALFPANRGENYFTKETPAYEDWAKKIGRKGCWKDWLVVVYMAADNDLSRYSWRDLFEMEQVGSTLDSDVVVFQDDAQQDGMRYYHVAKRPAFGFRQYAEAVKRYAKENGLEGQGLQAQEAEYLKAKGPELPVSPLIRVLPEGDSGDTKVAGEFLGHAFANYPSRRVLLVGWSHGEGFDAPTNRVKKALSRKGGFAFDFTSGTHMNLRDMVQGKTEGGGVKGLLKKLRGGRRIDVAGSDACLNQQVEFALEWKGVVDYVYGTAGLLQGKGFNYGPFLRNLNYRTDFPDEQRYYLHDLKEGLEGKGVGSRLKDHVAGLRELLKGESDPRRQTEIKAALRSAREWLGRQEAIAEWAKDPEKKEALEKRYLADDTRAFATNIPPIYGRSVSQDKEDLRLSYYDPDATMAVWDMERIDTLRVSLDDLARVLLHWILYPKDLEERNSRRWAILDDVLKRVRRYGNISQDLLHLRLELGSWVAKQIEETDPEGYSRRALQRIQGELEAVKRALEDAVPSKFLGKNFVSQTGLVPWSLSHGVAVWFPGSQNEFDADFAKFKAHSALYRSGDAATYWADFVESLYATDEVLEKMTDPIFDR